MNCDFEGIDNDLLIRDESPNHKGSRLASKPKEIALDRISNSHNSVYQKHEARDPLGGSH